jgi:hypothetical protein
MNYATEIGSSATIYSYRPSFTKTGSGTERLMGGGDYRHTDSMEIAKGYFHFFFKIRKTD